MELKLDHICRQKYSQPSGLITEYTNVLRDKTIMIIPMRADILCVNFLVLET